MGRMVERKVRFWHRSNPKVDEMSFAGATAGEGRAFGVAPQPTMRITVAEEPGEKIELIAIKNGMEPEAVYVNSNADILCLDLHDFQIESALKWITARQRFAATEFGAPAVIAVLGDIRRLTMDDRRRVSWDIEPAGAQFSRWPDDCNTFEDAFTAFADRVKETYRLPMVLA